MAKHHIKTMTDNFLNNVNEKNAVLKQKILRLCIVDGDYSISDFSRELDSSIPTITKLVSELIEAGYLKDLGKAGISSGRRPSIYGLNPDAGFIVGIDVRRHHISIAITDFKGQVIDYQSDMDFALSSTVESFTELCDFVLRHIEKLGIDKAQVLSYGVNLTGRVNHNTGYSYSYFIGEDKPIASVMEGYLGAPVFIENDSRAMCFGEYRAGAGNNESNMIFVNVSWGLGMGMVIDGKLFYGKSGFSGEIGHTPLLDNDIICQCGKVGCLETGASGSALHREFVQKLEDGKASILSDKYKKGEEITLDDITGALREEDILAIECVEHVGKTLGKALAGLINIFNPELVIIGGRLNVTGDYLLLPIKSAINKYSLNMVSKDTRVEMSKLGKKAGPIGACMLSRSRLLGLM